MGCTGSTRDRRMGSGIDSACDQWKSFLGYLFSLFTGRRHAVPTNPVLSALAHFNFTIPDSQITSELVFLLLC